MLCFPFDILFNIATPLIFLNNMVLENYENYEKILKIIAENYMQIE